MRNWKWDINDSTEFLLFGLDTIDYHIYDKFYFEYSQLYATCLRSKIVKRLQLYEFSTKYIWEIDDLVCENKLFFEQLFYRNCISSTSNKNNIIKG